MCTSISADFLFSTCAGYGIILFLVERIPFWCYEFFAVKTSRERKIRLLILTVCGDLLCRDALSTSYSVLFILRVSKNPICLHISKEYFLVDSINGSSKIDLLQVVDPWFLEIFLQSILDFSHIRCSSSGVQCY